METHGPDGSLARGRRWLRVLGRLSAAAAVVVPLVTALGGPAFAKVTSNSTVSATALRAAIQGPGEIRLVNVHVINGPLDLSRLGTVKKSIRCSNCIIDGGLIARDVTFDKMVDLTNVTVNGDLDVSGAVFDGAVLARGNSSARVTGKANLSFAHFASGIALDGITLAGNVDFEGASFGDDASFIGTNFTGDANFSRARFAGALEFSASIIASDTKRTASSGSVSGDVSFRGASFDGPVDFGLREFRGGLDLDHIRASGQLTLDDASVDGVFSANGASLGNFDAKRASIHNAQFKASQAAHLSLDSLAVDCSLDLSSTTVTGRASLRNLQFLDHADGCKVGVDQLIMADFTAGELAMDLSIADKVEDVVVRRAVLADIEKFERASGDVAKANEAHYRALLLDSRSKHGWERALDWVYRVVAGYLVLPLHPLLTLLVLIVLFSVARVVYFLLHPKALEPPPDPTDSPPSPTPDVKRSGSVTVTLKPLSRPLHATWTMDRPPAPTVPQPSPSSAGEGFGLVRVILKALSRSLQAIWRPKPPPAPDQNDRAGAYLQQGAKLFEYVTSKALILVFLLCLANYNSTLHDFINGILK